MMNPESGAQPAKEKSDLRGAESQLLLVHCGKLAENRLAVSRQGEINLPAIGRIR